MSLDELPDNVLIKIFSNSNIADIGSLQRTNQKLYDHITEHRSYYRTFNAASLAIKTEEDGKYKIVVRFGLTRFVTKTIPTESLKKTIESLNPMWLICEDNPDLLNMSRLWWKQRKMIKLEKVIDYRRYLPHFDRCTMIILECTSPVNLSEILLSIKSTNLEWLCLSGEIECTDDDIRKIGTLSNKMKRLELNNVSKSSHISNNAVLDMLETGSIDECMVNIIISQIADFENIEKCLENRKWVDVFKKPEPNIVDFVHRNGSKIRIISDELRDAK